MTTQGANVLKTGNLVGKEVEVVCDRIAAFFLAAGMSGDSLALQINKSIAKASKQKIKVKFTRAQDYALIERAIQFWVTEPNYVNRAGRPKPLPASGACSVSTLLSEAGFTGTTASAIKLMLSLGAISNSPGRAFVPTERHCNWHIDGDIAYEPHASFLMNAVMAATVCIGSTSARRKLFWRACHSDRIPSASIEKYLSFLRSKGEAVVLELNDWLAQHDAHEAAPQNNQPRTMLGVGLFPYIQTIQTGSANGDSKQVARRASMHRPNARGRVPLKTRQM
jgi:hypothetical protein